MIPLSAGPIEPPTVTMALYISAVKVESLPLGEKGTLIVVTVAPPLWLMFSAT